MSFKLRGYQQDLSDGIKNSILRGNKNILAVSPAGSGKTVIMADIAKNATDKGNRVLFIVHRIEIVRQVKQTFRDYGVDMDLCQIDMIQTVTRRLDTTTEPVIILVDEAHHSLAMTYQRIFKHFDKSFTIGFTATPELLSGKGLGAFYDDMVIGKSVSWLIENGNLAPFKYYSVNMLDDSQLGNTQMGDYTSSDIDEATKGVIYGDVIEHYKELADNTKTLVYTHSVQASKDVAEEFRLNGYNAKSVDGQTPEREREQAMQDFLDGELTILTNAELFGEGVNIPDCETVILLRPTASLSLHVQQSMRPMRYQEGKVATIIDHVGNVHRHGLPTTVHDWSLEDREVKSQQEQREDTIPVKECVECFGVIESTATECPLCGHEFEVEENELEQIDVELEEIDEVSFTVDYERQRWASKDINELETVEDHLKYAEARGYKKSWVKFQMPQFRHMSFPQFYNTIKKYEKDDLNV